MSRGDLFIVSAPSGAGKTTLIRALDAPELSATGSLRLAISHTTRRPRAGEVDGEQYRFVSVPEFQAMVEARRFLEWARVHGNLYGTSIEEVAPYLAAGVDVLLDIDVQGAASVLVELARPGSELFGTPVHSVFVMPPSYSALAERLEGRGLDDPVAIARRLSDSYQEVECWQRYDYVIVNDDAEVASRALSSIVLDKRQLRQRLDPTLRKIVEDFRARSRATGWRTSASRTES
jgi:guanylate kinase